jgi:hypothetical protein
VRLCMGHGPCSGCCWCGGLLLLLFLVSWWVWGWVGVDAKLQLCSVVKGKGNFVVSPHPQPCLPMPTMFMTSV